MCKPVLTGPDGLCQVTLSLQLFTLNVMAFIFTVFFPSAHMTVLCMNLLLHAMIRARRRILWLLKIFENNGGYLSGSPTPMWGVFSQQLSKIYRRNHSDVESWDRNIPLRGVRCHFKVSNNEVAAKCSKLPSVSFKSFKKQTYGETRVDVSCSKVRVKLHLWLHTLNCAWTLHWQRLTLSWKTSRRSRVGGWSEAKQWDQIRDWASYRELCNVILHFAPQQHIWRALNQSYAT